MPTDLQTKVRSNLLQILRDNKQNGSSIPVDILRVVRDESTLLYERELVFERFDMDPFELFGKDNVEMMAFRDRFKSMMQLVSISRSSSLQGNTEIESVLDIKDDEPTKKDGVDARLFFSYQRNPHPYESNLTVSEEDSAEASQSTTEISDANKEVEKRKKRRRSNGKEETCVTNGTAITYAIDLSRNYGKKERLLSVEVLASDTSPSPDPPQSMAENCNEDGGIITPGKDLFNVYFDPEVMVNFLTWTKFVEMDEISCIYFLMTFPFYEMEWDVLGLLLDDLFGGDDEEEEEETDNEE